MALDPARSGIFDQLDDELRLEQIPVDFTHSLHA
jgi:hypothetical protein